jgi:hypothetical protein
VLKRRIDPFSVFPLQGGRGSPKTDVCIAQARREKRFPVSISPAGVLLRRPPAVVIAEGFGRRCRSSLPRQRTGAMDLPGRCLRCSHGKNHSGLCFGPPERGSRRSIRIPRAGTPPNEFSQESVAPWAPDKLKAKIIPFPRYTAGNLPSAGVPSAPVYWSAPPVPPASSPRSPKSRRRTSVPWRISITGAPIAHRQYGLS